MLKSVYVWYDRSANPPPLTGTDIGWKADMFRFCPACASELTERTLDDRPRLVCPSCDFIRFRNPTPTLSVVVVQDGKILLGKRKAEPGVGRWAFPSGYIEYEEDFISAARREFKAETGLDVRVTALIHAASSFLSPREHFFYIYLQAQVVGGALVAGDDLEQAGWFALQGSLPDLAFREDADIIAALRSGNLNGLPMRLLQGESGADR